MREAGVNLVSRRHLLLGAARAGGGGLRLRLARPRDRPALVERDRDRPRDADRRRRPRGSSAGIPEVLPVTADGVRLEFGSRRHACPSSPDLPRGVGADRRAARAPLRSPSGARDVARHRTSTAATCPPATAPVSAAHFRRWLETRYGSIGGAEPRLGDGVLGPALRTRSPRSSRRAGRPRRSTRRRRSTGGGSPPTRSSSATRPSGDVLAASDARRCP